MTVTLAQIGNSQGIRIPQAILREVGFVDQAEMSIKNRQIILTPTTKNRKNWAQKFKNQASKSKAELFFPHSMNPKWDEQEWEW